MGAGNKLDPTRFKTADIFQTSVDPVAKILRKKLRERGIKNLKVVYSDEMPRPVKNFIGSISFVTSSYGVPFVTSISSLVPDAVKSPSKLIPKKFPIIYF